MLEFLPFLAAGLVVAGAVAYFLFFNKKKGAEPVSTSGWTFQHSFGLPSKLPADGTFKFGEPHYLVTSPVANAMDKTITLKYSVAGEGKLSPTDGTPETSPRIRFYMQRKGDRLTAEEASKRWWSKVHGELTPGDHELTHIIKAGEWTNVFGKDDDPEGFADTVNNMAAIGFTFGGDFAGHGVVADGDVSFTLKEWTVA